MEQLRSPFQGVYNILRFNWHFYVLAIGFVMLLILSNYLLPQVYHSLILIAALLISATVVTSLSVSCYIYDLSEFYKLDWLNGPSILANSNLININAGFDEISHLLKIKYPELNLMVCDFYEPLRHTEISIKRARKAYLPYEGTLQINTVAISLLNDYADNILLVFSAHEIRNKSERDNFFAELKRILKPGGKIILVEHLRDIPNFMAYNFGSFHFISVASWYSTFKTAGLRIYSEEKITPFITKFILEDNGTEY